MPSKKSDIAFAFSAWLTYWIFGRMISGSTTVSLSSGIEMSMILDGIFMERVPLHVGAFVDCSEDYGAVL